MAKIFNLLVLLAIVGGGYYYRDLIFPPKACEKPIPYKIGEFSKEFNLSEKSFLDEVFKAETVWEKTSGRDLFVYAPDTDSRRAVTVNLIYDYRQQATDKLGSLGITVQENRASYEALKQKLDALKLEYDRDRAAFNTRVSAFNARQEAYAKEVQSWNKRGGAPKNEYDRIEAERAHLVAESALLDSLQKSLNADADEINALVVVVNKLISVLNLSVEKYNDTSEARGETFEEGVYYTDGRSARIDVYEFSNREKLLRVLAHEFGHALGLGHIQDPKAIMYELNQGDTETLTASDIAALEALCAS